MATEWEQENAWQVWSTYADGDRVLERICSSCEIAEAAMDDVRQFREDQDEMPTIAVEKVPRDNETR